MVKHIQTIHRLLPTNCLSVFDHFVGLALKGLNIFWICSQVSSISHSSLGLSSLFVILRFFKIQVIIWRIKHFVWLLDKWINQMKRSRFSKPSIPSDTAFLIPADCYPVAMISLLAAYVIWLYASIIQLACNNFRTDTFSLISVSFISMFSSYSFPISLLYHLLNFAFHQEFEGTIVSQFQWLKYICYVSRDLYKYYVVFLLLFA